VLDVWLRAAGAGHAESEERMRRVKLSDWWCWHCMAFVPVSAIRLIEDSGGQTGYCEKHPHRSATPPATLCSTEESCHTSKKT